MNELIGATDYQDVSLLFCNCHALFFAVQFCKSDKNAEVATESRHFDEAMNFSSQVARNDLLNNN